MDQISSLCEAAQLGLNMSPQRQHRPTRDFAREFVLRAKRASVTEKRVFMGYGFGSRFSRIGQEKIWL